MHIYADRGGFLGAYSGSGRVGLWPEKNWHTPGSVKQVCQFVGFVGHHRCFIQNFAELLEPLVALTRKWSVFVWTSERQGAFKHVYFRHRS